VNVHAFYSPIEQFTVPCPTCDGNGELGYPVGEFIYNPSDAHNNAFFAYTGNRQYGQEASEVLSAAITRETPYKLGCWVNCQDGREHAWLLATCDFYDLRPAPNAGLTDEQMEEYASAYADDLQDVLDRSAF
jgi:hypothetical protein